jgi:hypothetical protein
MPTIRPDDPSARDSTARTGSAAPGADFEIELMRAERRLRWAREHPLFGIHPDGLGPTLGQDLGRPNPGHEVDWNDDHYDPPT